MNWPTTLSVSVIAINAVAAVLTFKSRKVFAIILGSIAAVISGIAAFVHSKNYSTEIPAVTASYMINSIRIVAVNVDAELPIKDVSVKVNQEKAVEIGTMYPRVVYQIIDLPFPQKNTTWVASIWYNDTERMEADFKISKKPDSTVDIKTSYYNANGVSFVPPWKERALRNAGDTTTQHYNPTLFK